MYHNFSLLESLDAVICVLLRVLSIENDWQITFKLVKISKRGARDTRIYAS